MVAVKWARPKTLSGKKYEVLTGPRTGQIGEQFAQRFNGRRAELMLWFEDEKSVQHYDERDVKLRRDLM